MPELFDVALHFDDIDIADAYTGTFAFRGQISSFNQSSRDGSVEAKRSISVAPNIVLPTRHVLSFLGETWLVGTGNVDGVYNRAIRKSYWTKKVEPQVLTSHFTPAELLSGSAGSSLYANKVYLKDTVNGVTDADYDAFWNVFTAAAEPVIKGHYFVFGSTVLRVRGNHLETNGFNLAECDELDASPLITVTIQASTSYNAITDTYGSNATVVPAIYMDAYKLYRYTTQADQKVNAGDVTLIVASPLPVGSTVIAKGVTYKVAGVQAEADAYNLHLYKP